MNSRLTAAAWPLVFPRLAARLRSWGAVFSTKSAPGLIRQSIRRCPPCDRNTAGSLNKDGWLCGECLTHQREGGA